MNSLARFILSGLVVFIASYVLRGVHVDNFLIALAVAVVLAVVNAVVRPVLVLLTLPATILSLGLFLLVINALMVLLVSWLIPGFAVDGFWWALLFSLVVSIFNSAVNRA